MCYSGLMPHPGAVTSGLTCEWESGRRERIGVCGGKGRFPAHPHPQPPRPCLYPLRSGFWLLGDIFSEGKITFPDFERPPSKPRRTLEISCVNKVRLGGAWGKGWRPRLAGPACGRKCRRSAGSWRPSSSLGKTPRVSQGRSATGRVRLRAPAPSAFPSFPWEGDQQLATSWDQHRPLTPPLAVSREGRKAPVFQCGQGWCFLWLAFSLGWTSPPVVFCLGKYSRWRLWSLGWLLRSFFRGTLPLTLCMLPHAMQTNCKKEEKELCK